MVTKAAIDARHSTVNSNAGQPGEIGRMVQILFYGRAADRIARRLDLDLHEDTRTIADLRRVIAKRHPDAAGEIASPALRACVGDVIVGEDHDIQGCGTIEFFPPLSGG